MSSLMVIFQILFATPAGLYPFSPFLFSFSIKGVDKSLIPDLLLIRLSVIAIGNESLNNNAQIVILNK